MDAMSYYYGHQNPSLNAGQKYHANDVTTVQIPVSGTSVVRDNPRWSWCSTVWSVLSMLFCACMCGFIGLLCAVHSYVDHKSGDYDGSSRKRKCAWGWSMTGLALGILLIIAAILVFVVFREEVYGYFIKTYHL